MSSTQTSPRNGIQRTPKRPPRETSGLADLYPYYAGYSFAWAQSAVERLSSPTDLVLDPWNGSGTTTQAASFAGRASFGFDLNPVAVTIARAKQIPGRTALDIARQASPDGSHKADEPLSRWFDPRSARRLRQWVNGTYGGPLIDVAAMRVVREATAHCVGSNPTWVRSPQPSERVAWSIADIDDAIRNEIAWLSSRLADAPHSTRQADVRLGDAGRLDLPDESVQLTLTSPPYLTRIDYGIAFTRELDVLGIPSTEQGELRLDLMGTTRSRRREPSVALHHWGKNLRDALDAVRSHPSKDASGYYHKQKVQYFTDLERALKQLHRVTTRGGHLQMVVQDSYFKDVPLLLSELAPEMASQIGWELTESVPHLVKRSLVSLNPRARNYAKSDVSETVLLFRKPSK